MEKLLQKKGDCKSILGLYLNCKRILVNTVLNKKTDIFYAHIDRL